MPFARLPLHPHPTEHTHIKHTNTQTVYTMPFTRLPTFALGCLLAILWHHHAESFTAYMHRGRQQLKTWGLIGGGLVLLGLVEWGPHRELAYVPGKW
jgi:peptidoglycan/LPS O-acetylase OafA/YrhL